MKYYSLCMLIYGSLSVSGFAQKADLLAQLMAQSEDSLIQAIAAQPETYQLQLIYTQVDRDADNRPSFTTYHWGVDSSRYFYPASTVKMPIAMLALEKLNELRILGLDKNTPMYTGAAHEHQSAVRADSSAENGLPSIAHYIKKIFVASDNDAYNRLYEFLGQGYINERLHAKGYTQTRVVHRLSAPGYTTESNRYTNPVTFHADNDLRYHQGPVYSRYEGQLPLRDQVRGKGYEDQHGRIVPAPFDFRHKNYMSLANLHDILLAAFFPASLPAQRAFRLSSEDYTFLHRAMGTLPRESDFPAYQEEDNYVKFLIFGDQDGPIPPSIRVFNKIGIAYGFLTDVAYVVDLENGVEFFLAASAHLNRNEIYNDGLYEYEEIGQPLFGRIGRIILAHERARERAFAPGFGALGEW